MASVETTWLLRVVGTQDTCPFRKMLCTHRGELGASSGGGGGEQLGHQTVGSNVTQILTSFCVLGALSTPHTGCQNPSLGGPCSRSPTQHRG